MMKKAVSIILIGLFVFTFGTISRADGDNTSTVFKGSGKSRCYDNFYPYPYHGLDALKSLEALDALDDEMDNLDLELDELDYDLDKLKKLKKNKYHYQYYYDHDFDDDNCLYYHHRDFNDFRHRNNMDIDFENGDIYITHAGRKSGSVRITEDYELYVNGKHIRTDNEQKRLLAEFCHSAEELHTYAVRIGAKGAEIGVEGAKIGLSAIGGLFRLILPGYDTDDLERDMERKSKRIEYKAQLLEKEAKALEHIAYDLEDIADELKHEIPELEKLRWF